MRRRDIYRCSDVPCSFVVQFSKRIGSGHVLAREKFVNSRGVYAARASCARACKANGKIPHHVRVTLRDGAANKGFFPWRMRSQAIIDLDMPNIFPKFLLFNFGRFTQLHRRLCESSNARKGRRTSPNAPGSADPIAASRNGGVR
jgi:hypothetical protein